MYGCDGSALHLAAFARPGTQLIGVDCRPTPNQLMIDAVRGLRAVHVLASSPPVPDRTTSWQADLALVRQAIDAAGLG